MNGVKRAVAVAAISMVCLGACGDSDPTPVDAGDTGTTQVMTDKTDSMTDMGPPRRGADVTAIRWVMALVAIGGVGASMAISRQATTAMIDAAVAGDHSAVAEPPVLDPGPAPSVGEAAGWLNTPGLDGGDLAGHVVLYDFWTFGCVNCRNTLPHVQAW